MGQFLPLRIWNKVSVNQIQLFLTKCKRHCIFLLNIYKGIPFLLSIGDWLVLLSMWIFYPCCWRHLFYSEGIDFYCKWRNMIWNLFSAFSWFNMHSLHLFVVLRELEYISMVYAFTNTKVYSFWTGHWGVYWSCFCCCVSRQ